MAHRVKRKPRKRVPPDTNLTDHHRRPTSIAGSQNHRNRKDIPQDIHRTWHELFANMCAPKIAAAMSALLKSGNLKVGHARNANPLHRFECPKTCALLCVTPWVAKRRVHAWERLKALIAAETGNKTSLHNTLAYINQHLIDADYCLFLMKL